MKKNLLTLVATFCSLAVFAQSGTHYEYMNEEVKPGTDFYQYATGNWIKYHPQPAEYPSWEAFGVVAEETNKQLMQLIDELCQNEQPEGTIGRKVADLYKLAMDSVRRNKEGAEPLMRVLQRIDDIKTKAELDKMMAQEKDEMFFGIGIGADMKNSNMNIMGVGQGGLSLGVRDYYLAKDKNTLDVRKAFMEHVVNLHKLCGYSEKEATRRMKIVMKYETLLAKHYYSMEQMRDPEANYHKMSVKELSDYTGMDFDEYFKARTYDATDSVDLGQPEPVKYGVKLYKKAKLDDLKVLYQWDYIQGGSNYLSDDFRAENFRFSAIRTGAQADRPRWKRALSLVNGTLGEAVGQMYVERYFPEDSKERMLNLVHGLQKSLSERISEQTWMSQETKDAALDKLMSITIKIGYPDKWEDLSGLKVQSDVSLFENIQEIARFYWELDKKKNYNKPVDKDEWGMTPQTINAYYNPTTNEICFPAAILQPPFFDAKADDAANFGAIGVVIGHEMTHGFDDEGAQFDKDGNLRVWWNKDDVTKFQGITEELAVHFDSLWVIPGELKANGHMCLGENIADHGGLMVAYQALQHRLDEEPLPVENGFTPAQRFFLSYAGVWAGVTTKEMLYYYTKMDVHSAEHLRVNGSLPHIDAWYEAFDIQPGMPLYIAPEKRIRIW